MMHEPVAQWVQWQPPRDGFVGLNTNGNSLGNSCPLGFGGIVRNSDETWLVIR